MAYLDSVFQDQLVQSSFSVPRFGAVTRSSAGGRRILTESEENVTSVSANDTPFAACCERLIGPEASVARTAHPIELLIEGTQDNGHGICRSAVTDKRRGNVVKFKSKFVVMQPPTL